ncbi:MAG TPA: hypothetical protein IAA30_01815 [Candidatus Treponema faecavium]|nr:hypothetical protein [Candidatus Treponema faecavium]
MRKKQAALRKQQVTNNQVRTKFADGKILICHLSDRNFADGQRRTCRLQIFSLPSANETFAIGKCLAGRRQISYRINGKCKICNRQMRRLQAGKLKFSRWQILYFPIGKLLV